MLNELKPPLNSPITCSINEACRQLGVGRTMFYELVRAGEIATTKIGRRRLPVVQSLYDYLNRQLASQI
jgi:excisionase family DNA binding protein